MSLPRARLQRMEPAILLGLAVLAILLLAVTLFVASIPLVWYLAAAALFFSGLIGPALGCLVLGAIASLIALARGN
jgi:hypothetical protein